MIQPQAGVCEVARAGGNERQRRSSAGLGRRVGVEASSQACRSVRASRFCTRPKTYASPTGPMLCIVLLPLTLGHAAATHDQRRLIVDLVKLSSTGDHDNLRAHPLHVCNAAPPPHGHTILEKGLPRSGTGSFYLRVASLLKTTCKQDAVKCPANITRWENAGKHDLDLVGGEERRPDVFYLSILRDPLEEALSYTDYRLRGHDNRTRTYTDAEFIDALPQTIMTMAQRLAWQWAVHTGPLRNQSAFVTYDEHLRLDVQTFRCIARLFGVPTSAVTQEFMLDFREHQLHSMALKQAQENADPTVFVHMGFEHPTASDIALKSPSTLAAVKAAIRKYLPADLIAMLGAPEDIPSSAEFNKI